MRAVYLALLAALVLLLGALEVIAERSVSAAYPAVETSIYFK